MDLTWADRKVRHNILVIDDRPLFARFLGHFLHRQGYGVKTFQTGEPGLDALLTGHFHLALVGIRLAGLSGPELCRALREHPTTRDLPVILTSAAFIDPAERATLCKEVGASDLLAKPFPLVTLQEKISKFLGPPPETDKAFRVTGRLEQTPFGHLLHCLYALGMTGLLHLERGEVQKTVYLKSGYPVFVRSNLLGECLGQMLVADGVITSEQCQESVRQMKESGHLQGKVLIDMGLLTPQRLQEAIRHQVTEKLLEIFGWQEGQFRFHQAQDLKEGMTAIDLPPAALVLQGLRRFGSPEQCAPILDRHRQSYLTRTENPHFRFQELDLTPHDARVLALCRGDLTLTEILDRNRLSQEETAQLLAALLTVEFLEGSDLPTSAAEEEENGWETREERRQRKELLEDYRRMMSLDYFALLEVGRDTRGAELRKAYFALVKRFHPDRFRQESLSPDLEKKVNELFQQINEAYAVLSDPQRRNSYLAELDGTKPQEMDVTEILEAETSFQKGRSLLRNGNFASAMAAFRVALKVSPDEPEYLTPYAWSLYKCRPNDPAVLLEAREILYRSAELKPRLDLTHLYLGHLLKQEDRLREAEEKYELALQCNPDCTEALRELRLFQMRREQEQKNKGLLGRVFHK